MSAQARTLVANMAEQNGNLVCDTCGLLGQRGSEEADAFEAIAWPDCQEVHLCGRCVSERDSGVLAESASTRECVRCSRDEDSG